MIVYFNLFIIQVFIYLKLICTHYSMIVKSINLD